MILSALKRIAPAIIVPTVLALGVAWVIANWTACTPAQTAAIYSALDAACIANQLAGSIIPTGTPATTVVADIQLVCGALPQLEAVVTAFEASQAASGTAPPAGAVYRAARRAAK